MERTRLFEAISASVASLSVELQGGTRISLGRNKSHGYLVLDRLEQIGGKDSGSGEGMLQ